MVPPYSGTMQSPLLSHTSPHSLVAILIGFGRIECVYGVTSHADQHVLRALLFQQLATVLYATDDQAVEGLSVNQSHPYVMGADLEIGFACISAEIHSPDWAARLSARPQNARVTVLRIQQPANISRVPPTGFSGLFMGCEGCTGFMESAGFAPACCKPE